MKEKTVRMISETPQTYKGRKIGAGEEFNATTEDAEDMIAMKWARKTSSKRTYQRRDMVAEK